MTILVLGSVTGHRVVAGIYNYFLLLCVLYSLCFLKHLIQLWSLPGGVTQIFISAPAGFGPLAILPDLDCCHFLLNLIVEHGNTRRHSKGFFIFQTHSSFLQCGEVIQIPLGSEAQSPQPA